jgi:hypothetical protein
MVRCYLFLVFGYYIHLLVLILIPRNWEKYVLSLLLRFQSALIGTNYFLTAKKFIIQKQVKCTGIKEIGSTVLQIDHS